MAYADDIDALLPDHRWPLSANSADAVGILDGTDTSIVYTGASLCLDVANSATTNADGDFIVMASNADINTALNDILWSGWFTPDKIQQPPVRIIGDGNSTQCMQIVMGFGNALIFEVDDNSDTLQVYGDTPLVPNRPYHLTIALNSTNKLIAYLDGVEQTDTADQQASGSLASRSQGLRFGGSTGTNDFAIGGTNLKVVSTKNGFYNQWATWYGSLPTATEIREELFEKGAKPETTITDQAGLTALADTVRGNDPLCILVNVTGSISLSADNVTFDPLASIHVQYNGTGTLTWTNTNGSDASIGSVTSTGNIIFVNPVTLTINGLIDGCEFRIYDNESSNGNNMDTELDGIETLSGTSFVFNHDGAVNDIIIQMIDNNYVEVNQNFTLSNENQLLTLFPALEANS